MRIPVFILDIGGFSHNPSIEPHLTAILVPGHHPPAHTVPLSRWVVIVGNVVAREQTLSFVIKFHFVFLASTWKYMLRQTGDK